MDKSGALYHQSSEMRNKDRIVADYLNGNLDPAAEHAFERKAEEDNFLQEALEGLRTLPAGDLPQLREELNLYLKNKIKAKKNLKRGSHLPSYIIFAVIILLLLLLASFLLLQKIL
jgi:hypothetical protein